MSTTPPLTPVQEAEQARQVVNVLARVEQRFHDGRWDRGYRFAPGGGNCMIGAIDEATAHVLPGVAERATAELAARLPAPFRALGRVRPRLALATWNDTVASRDDAVQLVSDARCALGGLPLTQREPAPRSEAIEVGEAWTGSREPARMIDLTEQPALDRAGDG